MPSLKQQLLPSLEFPAAFIVAPYPGAGPEIVEEQVTKPIENAIQGIPGWTRSPPPPARARPPSR